MTGGHLTATPKSQLSVVTCCLQLVIAVVDLASKSLAKWPTAEMGHDAKALADHGFGATGGSPVQNRVKPPAMSKVPKVP